MQKKSPANEASLFRLALIYCLVLILSLFLFSFTVNKINEEFLKQLGITKTEADKKITNSILGGYLDAYGVKNAKNIAMGNRAAVTRDLLTYTRKYVSSPAFSNEYAALKERNKPAQNKIQTPEEMQANLITQYKKSVTDMEAMVKKADASLKPNFEKALADSKKLLAEAEGPNNKVVSNYQKNYPAMVKSNQQNYENRLKEWEVNYPANQLLYVKKRLQQFMIETEDIDFNAALTVRNGKKVFVDPNYERKGNRWKMGFRAGKEVVETARSFVQVWMQEIDQPTN